MGQTSASLAGLFAIRPHPGSPQRP